MSERGEEPRTLEMRLAAIEDKLAQMSISEEEMRAYHKVAALMGGRTPAAAPSPQLSPTLCTTYNCVIAIPISVSVTPHHNCAQFAAPMTMLGAAPAGTANPVGAGFAGLGTR